MSRARKSRNVYCYFADLLDEGVAQQRQVTLAANAKEEDRSEIPVVEDC